MPRFFGNVAAYFALLGMIAGSAIVTYGEIKDAVKGQFLRIGSSIVGASEPAAGSRSPGMEDDLADIFVLEESALEIKTFDESLRDSEEWKTEGSKTMVREHLLRTEKLGKQVANRLSGGG